MTEKQIISHLQQRIALCEDMKAYRRLYELLYERLFWFSYSFVKSREVAEEIVSDVFIKIWNIRDELRSVDNLTVYLYIIAKNCSLNYITKKYRYPQVSLDDIQFEVVSNINPEELYISAELGKKIREVIAQLPTQCRFIFQMVREDGLKPKEVAEILSIAEMTVRNQLTIAARKIALALQPHLQNATTRVDPSKVLVTGTELMQGSKYPYGQRDKYGTSNEGGADVQYGRFLDELGYEFFEEAHRRQDMIRFGVFTTKKWLSHTSSAPHKTLFPIPQVEINKNSKLKQNFGY
jgi:RNA polymerase sigma-70 factor, Bacteroides expansion family 1